MGWLRFLRWTWEAIKISIRAVFTSDSNRAHINHLQQSWAPPMLKIARIHLNITWCVPKRQVLRLGKAIVISNHQSYSDIPTIQVVMQHPLQYMVKKELSRLPLWGAAMIKAGFVPVDRKRRGKSDIMSPVAEIFAREGWLFIAPEGTRSQTGELQAFRSGAFWLAVEHEVPIIVVGMKGTRDVMPKGSFWVTPDQHISASILAVLDSKGKAVEGLKAEARDIMSSYLTGN